MSDNAMILDGVDVRRSKGAARALLHCAHLTKTMALGLATHMPGVRSLAQRRSRGSDSARYCYSVWLRHLETAHLNGLCDKPPAHVAELGPGDTIGVGLAALLSGAETYVGLDAVPYASLEQNLAVFDELVALFAQRANIPGPDQFPKVKPLLDGYAFPHRLLTPRHMERCLAPARLARIRRAIETGGDGMIAYAAPWRGAADVPAGAIDMLLSQAVMLYVDDLADVYAEAAAWLKPGGFMSHQIDFKSLGYANEWNGNWRYSDPLWRLLQGTRTYMPNRAPHSAHIAALEAAGLTVVADLKHILPNELSRTELAPRFRDLSSEDLTISGACIQAMKPLSVSCAVSAVAESAARAA